MSTELIEQAVAAARTHFALREVTPAEYRKLQYPRLLPVMKFTAHQYKAEGFGNVMTLDTTAMGGRMRLATMVFTPSAGADMPLLLIDTMEMGKKSLAYLEYYDCTAAGAVFPAAAHQAEEYAHIPDYAEKPAWYVARRTPYSLIKQKGEQGQSELDEMVRTCLARYLAAAAAAPCHPENRAGLRQFQQDMIERGNPSSATMEKVLGKAGARTFFETVIMPV